MEDKLIFICSCHSFEHQITFWWDDDTDELHSIVHLYNHDNFFKRLWSGLRYAFGYTSRYGDWDDFYFTKEDQDKLLKFLTDKSSKK